MISQDITAEFTRKYMPKRRTKCKIWEKKYQMFWEVNFVPRTDGAGRFGKNWTKVHKHYDLEEGDELTFTFIKPGEIILDVVKMTEWNCSICLEGKKKRKKVPYVTL